MSLCLASQFGPPFLVPIPGPEQPIFFFSTRGVDQSLRGAATAQGRAHLSRRNKPKFTGFRRRIDGILRPITCPLRSDSVVGRTACSGELPEAAA